MFEISLPPLIFIGVYDSLILAIYIPCSTKSPQQSLEQLMDLDGNRIKSQNLARIMKEEFTKKV